MFRSRLRILGSLLRFTDDVAFVPTTGSEEDLLAAAYVAALKDRSLSGGFVRRACRKRARALGLSVPDFERRMSAVVSERHAFVKEGSLEQIEAWVRKFGGFVSGAIHRVVSQVEGRGGYVVVVASNEAALGALCFVGNPALPLLQVRRERR